MPNNELYTTTKFKKYVLLKNLYCITIIYYVKFV